MKMNYNLLDYIVIFICGIVSVLAFCLKDDYAEVFSVLSFFILLTILIQLMRSKGISDAEKFTNLENKLEGFSKLIKMAHKENLFLKDTLNNKLKDLQEEKKRKNEKTLTKLNSLGHELNQVRKYLEEKTTFLDNTFTTKLNDLKVGMVESLNHQLESTNKIQVEEVVDLRNAVQENLNQVQSTIGKTRDQISKDILSVMSQITVLKDSQQNITIELEEIVKTHLNQLNQEQKQQNTEIVKQFQVELEVHKKEIMLNLISPNVQLNKMDELSDQLTQNSLKLRSFGKEIETIQNDQQKFSSHIHQRNKVLEDININVLSNRFTKPPIIIGGCGRSGTTLLLSILSAHPEIYAIDTETGIFCPTIWSENPDLNTSFDLKRISKYITETNINHKRWMEKTPSNIHFFDRILDQFEDVKLIQIVRDGRDVILSKHPSAPERYWVSPERWVKDVTAGLKFKDHNTVKTIRYEDLILDKQNTIQELCDFLELKYNTFLKKWYQYTTIKKDAAWFNDVQQIHSESIGKWKNGSNNDRIESARANKSFKQLLDYYNYE